ncbi:MAG: carbohydrate-binding protein, partial [Bacteroidetes bacterium]|nr:carbohydrate-binding protein [Bacteroidota bacterium]
MLPYMEEQYEGWLETNYDADHGLFFKSGHDDGMEININSRQLTDNWTVEGYRPTLNSYLFGDLVALSQTALLAGQFEKAMDYLERAGVLKARVIEELWDPGRAFFFHQFKGDHAPGIRDKSLTYETGPYAGSGNGRELIGYVPWQFNLPDEEHSVAWQFLMDEAHFSADYGPTTVSQSDTLFMLTERCCIWSGQSWPYATTQTLVAMANLLNNYEQEVVDRDDYVELLRTYTRTQFKDGRPYIAESANPYTGSWFGSNMPNHSEHYSHSGYADLILSGLLGIRPMADGTLVVNPLIPDDWDWFAAEGVRLHGHDVDVIWDRDGSKYG